MSCRSGAAPHTLAALHRLGLPVLLATLVLAACATRVWLDAPSNQSVTVDELGAAIAADARRSDAEADAKAREALAADAGRIAKACMARAPQHAACLYYRAIALGLDARAHPLRAGAQLRTMLDALSSAESADPGYDHAGPARVRALVLIRAPGWPVGPGDIDAGLQAARRAVDLEPAYPPNVLALAEALFSSGDVAGAHRSYARARDLGRTMPSTKDRDDWLRQADQGLQRGPGS